MSDWWKTASATFAGGVVAIGLVAVPTFVFLPREFDALRVLAEEAKFAAVDAKSASNQTLVGLEAVGEKFDDLIVSIAQADAKSFSMAGKDMMAGDWSAPLDALQLNLPTDVYSMILVSGQLESFRYSDFNGENWVFIENSEFNKFSSDQQKLIRDSFEASSFFFITD